MILQRHRFFISRWRRATAAGNAKNSVASCNPAVGAPASELAPVRDAAWAVTVQNIPDYSGLRSVLVVRPYQRPDCWWHEGCGDLRCGIVHGNPQLARWQSVYSDNRI
jgi:hypothetical protein